MEIETHPFEPFVPQGAKLLMLGTFPPAQKRWCMEFYYPNFQNDMWRIMGVVFHGDKDYFVDVKSKSFRLELIKAFLRERGIAIYDTAYKVRRTRNTASDKDLQIMEPVDVDALLEKMPQCTAVVTAGQLATELFTSHFSVEPPPMGGNVPFFFLGREMRLYRMPSSSRAYPMRLEDKAAKYAMMFNSVVNSCDYNK